jgi:hypothetical protein
MNVRHRSRRRQSIEREKYDEQNEGERRRPEG